AERHRAGLLLVAGVAQVRHGRPHIKAEWATGTHALRNEGAGCSGLVAAAKEKKTHHDEDQSTPAVAELPVRGMPDPRPGAGQLPQDRALPVRTSGPELTNTVVKASG